MYGDPRTSEGCGETAPYDIEDRALTPVGRAIASEVRHFERGGCEIWCGKGCSLSSVALEQERGSEEE